MRSPRILRPDTVTLFVPLPENEDGDVLYHRTVLKHVRYDANYGIVQSAKGIDTNYKVLVVIDMDDLVGTDAGEIENLLIKGKTMICNGEVDDSAEHVTVNEVKPIHALSRKIEFIEVYCS